MKPVLLLLSLLSCGVAWGDTIVGAGTTFSSQVFADAQFAYRFVNPDLEVKYYASDSQAGICRIESAANECNASDTRAPSGLDFAASTSILNQTDYNKYPDLQMYPVLATGVVLVYNLKGVKGLVLPRTTLAQIFYGLITTWDDSRIRAYNSNFSQWNIPSKQKIEVVVRQESSDVTMVFKSALYDFYASFANYVEVSPRPTWGSLKATRLEGGEAVNSYVLQNPWTLSYSVMKDAVDANLPRALIWKSSDNIVEASLKSINFAVLEMGLDFGSNGDSASHLTADLNNARGVNGWAIMSYTYIVLRKSTLRAGATCDTVRQTVAFWQWFLTADVIQSIAEAQYSVQPPSVVRDIVVQRLVSDVTCLDEPVYQATESLQVTASGEASMAQIFQELAEVYTVSNPTVSLQYSSGSLNTSDAVAAALATNQFVAILQPSLAPASGTQTLVFAGVAMVVISQYDLVLDISTLVRILEGDITTWLHPDLLTLNPNGIMDWAGNNITNASQRILLLNGPTSDSDAFRDLMQAHAPGFVGKALQAAYRFRTEEQLRTVVAGSRFTLAITLSTTEHNTRIQSASLQRSEGNVVAPSSESFLACASSVAYSMTGGLDLSTSTDAACYPLSQTVYLTARTPHCSNISSDSVDSQAVAFLSWVFSDNGTAAALEGRGVAFLAAVSPAVKAANTLALSSLSCSTATTAAGSSTNIAPIVAGACVGAFFLIAIPAGWYVWKSTRDMKALRKQFSDVKVAEDCAEAIACFDLEAVSWLSTLANPSKIQLAFLHIVNLLVEVKPFIPDQLLAQLQAAKMDEVLKPEHKHRPHRQDTSGDEQTVATSQSRSSLRSSLYSSRSTVHNDPSKVPDGRSNTVISEDSSGVRRGGRGARGAPNTMPGHQTMDHFRRTCTYMFVRFTLNNDPEEDKLGHIATAVAAHVVTLAKAHGATIDKVTYDSVALHWNVSGQHSGGPLQATSLAMELACTAQILPSHAQDDLRLLVSIGHGQSIVATVSAAGQRFFVVGGREITNAVEVVMREAALPLGCTILLSNAVQQEIKYSFRCSPRLWFRDVLFWEPVEQRGGCKQDDEWMYQIKHLEEDDTTMDVGRAMHDVFILAHTAGQSTGVLQREVRHLQQTYAAHLTPQDLASLHCLQDCSAGRKASLPVAAA